MLLRAARRATLVLVMHRDCPALGRSREDREKVVGLRGLEPLTSSLSGKRSNRLSYRPVRHLQRAQYLQVDKSQARDARRYLTLVVPCKTAPPIPPHCARMSAVS